LTAPVLKTGRVKALVGSNPTLSANLNLALESCTTTCDPTRKRRHSVNPSRIISVFLVSVLVAELAGCVTSPTGRNQILLNSEAQMAQMGRTAFADIQSKTPRSVSTGRTGYVRCVASAVTAILSPQELRPIAVDRWEVDLFEDATANAFALPGGKIGVNTGLLDVAVTPGQLAAVLGHEVSHVLARHGNERISLSTLAQSGMVAAQIMLGADTPEKQSLFGLLGLGVQYGVLMPFGREQESEADEIGILLMARAGFDPRESVALWQNMARMSGGQAPPEFMSTHPSHTTRIARLKAAMPVALRFYEQARASGLRPSCR
jgi:predicted Zn-dependent protease